MTDQIAVEATQAALTISDNQGTTRHSPTFTMEHLDSGAVELSVTYLDADLDVNTAYLWINSESAPEALTAIQAWIEAQPHG